MLTSLLRAYEGHDYNNVIGFRSRLRVTHKIMITIVFKLLLPPPAIITTISAVKLELLPCPNRLCSNSFTWFSLDTLYCILCTV